MRALDPRERKVLDGIARVATAALDVERLPALDAPLVEALQLDSLRRLTLLVALEDWFRVILPDDQLERVRTLAELCHLIARLLPDGEEARP